MFFDSGYRDTTLMTTHFSGPESLWITRFDCIQHVNVLLFQEIKFPQLIIKTDKTLHDLSPTQF